MKDLALSVEARTSFTAKTYPLLFRKTLLIAVFPKPGESLHSLIIRLSRIEGPQLHHSWFSWSNFYRVLAKWHLPSNWKMTEMLMPMVFFSTYFSNKKLSWGDFQNYNAKPWTEKIFRFHDDCLLIFCSTCMLQVKATSILRAICGFSMHAKTVIDFSLTGFNKVKVYSQPKIVVIYYWCNPVEMVCSGRQDNRSSRW